jgi:acid stress-induced BolA-like protein IbaG/YrbA
MVKTTQVATELTEAEINDLKRVTNQKTIKDALQDAVEYRIMHASKIKER